MPQYFRMQGFYTFATGKIYHAHVPPDFDAAKSWDEMVYPADKFYPDSESLQITTATGGQVTWVDAAAVQPRRAEQWTRSEWCADCAILSRPEVRTSS